MAKKKRKPISPFEFVLVSVIIGLIALIGLQLLLSQSAPARPIVVAQVRPSPTTTSTPTLIAMQVDLASLPTQDLPPTWTSTPTWTPTPTRSATPTDTSTPPPTAKPPLPGLRPTVTPAFFVVIANFSPEITETLAPTPVPLIDLPRNTINIVLLGSDQRINEPGWRTDVIIVVSINPDLPSVNMFSIPRDTWLYIPNWRYTRINLADSHGEAVKFPGGGPGLVAQTLQYNFGIPVQYFARVNFDGFKKLIDSVDGVDVIADCPLYDIFPDNPPDVSDIGYTAVTGTINIPVAGVYHLDGKHALWYARSRKTTSDFDRSRRQQRVLRALWAKVREQGLINKLPDIWGDLLNTVQTDLSLNDVIYLANLGTQIDRSHMKDSFLDGASAHYFTSVEGASVFSYNYKEISSTIQTAFLPPNMLQTGQAPASIEVLNGTGNPDWDAVGADRLNWAGYQVTKYGPADRSNFADTLIYDLRPTSKGSRLSELGRLFRVPENHLITQPDPDAGAEYRVILGADFEPCQRASLRASPARTPTPVPPP